MSAGCTEHGQHGTCERCGEYICPRCRRWLAERAHCAACVERIGHKPSGWSMLAISLATLGMAFPPLGLAAAALGWWQLGRVKAAAVSPASESFARVALVFGIGEAVVLVGWIAWSVFGG